MQPAPRPLASVSLGGSLRASRAALLARPQGPLSAVDLADGRALTAEDLGAGWVACAPGDDAPAPCGPPLPDVAAAAFPGPVRRRRLGAALVLAGALGAAVVALAGGFSAAPAPAVAGPVAHAPASPPPPPPPTSRAGARGGRAAGLPRPNAPPPAPPPPPPAAAPAVAVPPAAPARPPPPPPLPELPSAPAL